MAGKSFQVTRVDKGVYLDHDGRPVNGYTLRVDLLEFGESIDVNMPTNDPVEAKKEITRILANRRALANLSE